MEKAAEPTVEDICAAAALAVIDLLGDERNTEDGPWFEAVTAWRTARIRKLVRRARGAQWLAVQQLDGVTATVGTAQVRAFVPGLMDCAPPELAKLQIQSNPLPEPRRAARFDRGSGGGSGGATLVIGVTPEVEMSWGKRAAQCAHGGQLAWERASESTLANWVDAGRPIVVVHADASLWAELLALPDAVPIHDGGFTEIPAGTLTAVGVFV